MNRGETYRLLTAELAAYRKLRHSDLVELIGDSRLVVRRGSDGIDYSIELRIRLLDPNSGDIVVSASVGPANWGSHHDRLDDQFIVSKIPSNA